MPIISDRDRLKREFRKDLKSEVTIRLFSQGSSLLTIPGRDCKYCPQTQELMDELAGLSPKLHLEVYDFYNDAESREKYGVERIPAIVLGKNGVDGLKFYGIPLGYEFAAIIEDIKIISRGVSPLTMDSRKKLRKVNQPVHIQVFVTPTCGYCPAMARLAPRCCHREPADHGRRRRSGGIPGPRSGVRREGRSKDGNGHHEPLGRSGLPGPDHGRRARSAVCRESA